MAARPISIRIDAASEVSALIDRPRDVKALLVLAHGTGTGMTHRHMAATTEALATRGITALRFNFPHMEKGAKRQDSPAVACAAVRAAVARARKLAGDTPVFAGGRSFGGHMTSQAQTEEAMPGVRALVFLAWPLHPSGEPGTDRA